ncbi:MAG: FtsX-like permease family protein [Bacteroidetes bacterium]|nr:FtsX-like permease family protein [Bacteroidota bacterium]
MILRLAWRNLWRNRRRTFITIAMIVGAVVLSVTMQSVQNAMYDRNIDNMVRFSKGYIQVAAAGHKEDNTLETSVDLTPELREKILSIKGVRGILPRIQNFGLAALDTMSKDVMILGTVPEVEDEQTGLKKHVIKGEYFKAEDQSVMVAKGLAKRLQLSVGDTIVIVSMGYHGNSANGKFPVKAILELASPELNKRVMYMPEALAQRFFSLGTHVSDISILLDDNKKSLEISKEMQSVLGDKYEAKHWTELLPELKQMVEGDAAGGYIMYGILYVIIAFGVFGTVLMMLSERRREFGVVTAVGMKRRLLAIIVVIENFISGLIGAVAGMILALPGVLYLKYFPVNLAGQMKEAYEKIGFEPLILADIYPWILLENAGLVFLIALGLSIYPVVKILKIRSIDYLRS